MAGTRLVRKRCAGGGTTVALLALATGCVLPGPGATTREQAVADAARLILTLDPNAIWCDAYNRLVDLGPASLVYLMRQPAMTRPATPGDLSALLHTSLVRLLAEPTAAPPHLSASCLETTLGILHFDLKVSGHRLGPIVIPRDGAPTMWHDLYPAEFDHPLAMMVDVEGDRQALRAWWAAHHAGSTITARQLQPRARHLWQLLSRRYADRWEYHPEPRATLCLAPPRGPALLDVSTGDYNLVRAACVWLGSSPDAAVQNRLIELVGDASPVVAYNARFALRHSPDERVREVIGRSRPR